MKTETKVELLKYMMLDHSYDEYEMVIYNLISHNRLRDEVAMIDEHSFSFNIDPVDGQITANQFLVNMNAFVRYMKSYFYNIASFNSCIDYIVDNNKDLVNNLLSVRGVKLYNFYNGHEDSAIKELISKLIISNFISNAKYIESIRNVLNDLQVPLKRIEDYISEESMQILQLMSDIAFCQRGRGPILSLFENMKNHLKEYDNMDLSRRKKSVDDFKKKYIDSRVDDYNKLIKSYYSKKKYLKYFV